MSLKITDLSKRFHDKWALRNINLDIGPGEILGVVGPSGSGKTTLLRAIAGVIDPNGGSILVNGTHVSKKGSLDRGITFGQANPLPILSRLASLFVGEEAALPSGQWQSDIVNAGVYRATIMRRDSVVLFDNPFALMEPAIREQSFTRLRRAATEFGLAVLVTSNDFEEVLPICDRIAVMVNGEIIQTGSPKVLYEEPENRVVASVTCRNNLFQARRVSSSKADVPEFHTIDGGHRLFARKTDRSALGALNQNVTLAIRPENISISFGASFPADNLLKAVVTGSIFLGPTTLVTLDATGLRLEAIVLRLVGLETGSECMIGMSPERLVVLTK